jgi:hypothetical protein
MKIIKVLLFTVLVTGINFSCSAQTKKDNESANITKVDKVEVYYFHYTRRCATCNAVESVSKEVIDELYGNKVVFAGYNLDEEAGEAKGKELGVSGQTLLIVAGSDKINITNEGFMNARSNPDKLKAIIKEKIDPFL